MSIHLLKTICQYNPSCTSNPLSKDNRTAILNRSQLILNMRSRNLTNLTGKTQRIIGRIKEKNKLRLLILILLRRNATPLKILPLLIRNQTKTTKLLIKTKKMVKNSPRRKDTSPKSNMIHKETNNTSLEEFLCAEPVTPDIKSTKNLPTISSKTTKKSPMEPSMDL